MCVHVVLTLLQVLTRHFGLSAL